VSNTLLMWQLISAEKAACLRILLCYTVASNEG